MNPKIIDRLSDEEADSLLIRLLKRRPLAEIATAKEQRIRLTPISEHVDSAKERVANWGKMQGLSSGYAALDDLTHGMVGGELIVVGGETSHGKTQLASNVAYQVAKSGTPVLFVTLEMTKVELTARFMKLGEPDDVTVLPILYQEATEVGYQDINALVRKAVEDGVRFVVIDHLHYFVRSVEYVASEIGKIVKEFKRAAIEYDVPIMLLSHVRKIAKGTTPDINDLRDSSFIGQDADIVLMVWRNMDVQTGDPNDVQVAILKNRNRGLFPGHRSTDLWSDSSSRLLEPVPGMLGGVVWRHGDQGSTTTTRTQT